MGLLVFMMLGVPIVYSLGFCAVAAGLIAFGPTCLPKVGWTPFHSLFNLAWTPLPLFVLLGSVVAETGIGQDLFKAASNWLGRIPGGLIVSGIMGEAAMAATLGTSAATAIVVGKVAVPEFERYGYNRSLSLGALLAGGALGPLIPPSATFIIISVLADLSLGKLFIAGIIPGIILAIMLSIPAVLICKLRPDYAPPGAKVSWGERFSSLKRVWPVAVVILAILGSIYMGVATPTEAAGVGAVIAFIMTLAYGKFTWSGLKTAVVNTAKTTSMVIIILVGAACFSSIFMGSGGGEVVRDFIVGIGFGKWGTFIIMMVILFFLGMFIDWIGIIMITFPIFLPIAKELGFDKTWFVVTMAVMLQDSFLTPPFGYALFYLKGVAPPEVKTSDIYWGAFPFWRLMELGLLIVVIWPATITWLANVLVR